MRTREEISYEFTPVGQMSSTQNMALLKTQNAFKDLALEIERLVPDTPHRTAAIRMLLNSKWTCVQAITHINNEKEIRDEQEKATKEKAAKQLEAEKALEQARIKASKTEISLEGKDTEKAVPKDTKL